MAQEAQTRQDTILSKSTNMFPSFSARPEQVAETSPLISASWANHVHGDASAGFCLHPAPFAPELL